MGLPLFPPALLKLAVSQHRFFVSPEVLAAPQICLTQELAHRISRVLRLSSGDHIHLLDGSGYEIEAEITAISREEVLARALGSYQPRTEPLTQVYLYQAALPGERFEWVLEKGTELGVSHFIPLVCTRNTAKLPVGGKEWERKLGHWQAIVRSAAEQSHRARLPRVEAPMPFARAITAVAQPAIMAWERSSCPLKPVLAALAADKPPALSAIVGPEGGFTDEEVALARSAGVHLISLGPRVLRAETAAIIMVALALYQLDELQASAPACGA